MATHCSKMDDIVDYDEGNRGWVMGDSRYRCKRELLDVQAFVCLILCCNATETEL